jgi:hypothetical protein
MKVGTSFSRLAQTDKTDFATIRTFRQKVLAADFVNGSFHLFSQILTLIFVCRPSTNSCAKAVAPCAQSQSHPL